MLTEVALRAANRAMDHGMWQRAMRDPWHPARSAPTTGELTRSIIEAFLAAQDQAALLAATNGGFFSECAYSRVSTTPLGDETKRLGAPCGQEPECVPCGARAEVINALLGEHE